MHATLIRDREYLGATLGNLIINEQQQFKTLELPWLNNKRELSCIPVGQYQCNKIMSPNFGLVFEVSNVPNRSHILIHIGNTAKDTHGCILIGLRHGELEGSPAVLQSRLAVKQFLDLTKTIESFELCIS